MLHISTFVRRQDSLVFGRGTATCRSQKELMLRLQGIRSPNSLIIFVLDILYNRQLASLKQSVV